MFPVGFCAVNSSINGVKYVNSHINNIPTDIGQIKTLIYVRFLFKPESVDLNKNSVLQKLNLGLFYIKTYYWRDKPILN